MTVLDRAVERGLVDAEMLEYPPEYEIALPGHPPHPSPVVYGGGALYIIYTFIYAPPLSRSEHLGSAPSLPPGIICPALPPGIYRRRRCPPVPAV